MTLLFWISLLALFYIFVGYPGALILLAKIRRKPVKKDESYRPTVEAIVIVHNEQQAVEKKIRNLLSLNYPTEKLSITIVSDASTDDTVSVVNSFDSVKLIANEQKTSKAACLNQAIAESDAEVLLLTDVRQWMEADVLMKMLPSMADSTVAAVSGELVFYEEGRNDFAQGMDAYWKYEKLIRKTEAVFSSTVGVTGAIYVLKRAAFQPIPSDTILDDVLIPMQAVLSGQRVLFEDSAYAFDIPSSDSGREKRRKTRTIAGNYQLVQLNPKLINPLANPLWWQFVSHKLSRLTSPLFLMLCLLSNLFIVAGDGHWFYGFTLASQLLGYLGLLIAHFTGLLQGNPIIRIGRSFMSMMYFTTLGGWAFMTGRHLTLWK